LLSLRKKKKRERTTVTEIHGGENMEWGKGRKDGLEAPLVVGRS